MEEKDSEKKLDFIRNHITEDVSKQKNDGRVHTRFPPEPNGYLHLGHVKSICLNFGIAKEFDGLCNLRLDDTNPVAEKIEYANAIKQDVRWLGFSWDNRLFHASDYFEQLYEWAIELIKKDKHPMKEKMAYCHVCYQCQYLIIDYNLLDLKVLYYNQKLKRTHQRSSHCSLVHPVTKYYGHQECTILLR